MFSHRRIHPPVKLVLQNEEKKSSQECVFSEKNPSSSKVSCQCHYITHHLAMGRTDRQCKMEGVALIGFSPYYMTKMRPLTVDPGTFESSNTNQTILQHFQSSNATRQISLALTNRTNTLHDHISVT